MFHNGGEERWIVACNHTRAMLVTVLRINDGSLNGVDNMQFTIELNDTVVSMRNGANVTVAADKLTDEMVGNLLAYGIGQKVRDAASQASTQAKETGGDVKEIAQALMEQSVANIYDGKWSVRGEGTGVDTRTAVARSIVRRALKAKLGAKSKEFAKFSKLDPATQNEKLDANYQANAAIFDPAIDEEIARRAAAQEAKKGLAAEATFDI